MWEYIPKDIYRMSVFSGENEDVMYVFIVSGESEDVMLPCEFCEQLLPGSQLAFHQVSYYEQFCI